jgi:UDP-glucose 4-epimerase
MFVRYYHNITSNTLLVLESMAKHDVNTLIYSSTCATYGEPEKMPITEVTPQVGNLTFDDKFLVFFLHLRLLQCL